MPRSKNAVPSHWRRRRLIGKTKGRWGGKSRLLRSARETYEKGLTYAYRDRRNRKRDMRRLWIIRINAAARMAGLTYSRLMNGLKKKKLMEMRWKIIDIILNLLMKRGTHLKFQLLLMQLID